MGVVTRDIWLDSEVCLWFLQGDDEPRFLDCTGLSDVYIGQALENTWECSYCGSTVSSEQLKCDACNAPRRTRKRRATATAIGMLPEPILFDAAKDGFTLEARRRYGAPFWYDGSECLARMTNCRVIEKRIPTLSPASGGEEVEPVRLIVKIEGDFSFADAEHEDEQNPNR